MRRMLCMNCLLLALLLLCSCAAPSASASAFAPAATPDPLPETTEACDPTRSVPQTPSTELITSATPSPTPSPTPEPTPPPSPFGIVWLPDTQLLSYFYPRELEALGQEIAARRETDNLIAVIHTGDLVDNGFKEWEWDNFDLCLSGFSDSLPFYPVAGNHDLGSKVLRYDAYLKRSFLSQLPEDQTFGRGKMYYVVIEKDGVELLLLFVGWGCGKTAQEKKWLDEVFLKYPETPCILITHAYLKDDGTLHSEGAHLERYVVAAHPNVRLVLCGHRRNAVTATFPYDDDGDGTPDRTVPALMLNRQDESYQYRILSFDPVARTIDVRTYAIGDPAPVEQDDSGPLCFTLTDLF